MTNVSSTLDAPALALGGVSVRFGGVHALSEVDLDVRSGEVRGLIGPNGAGKTTLFDVVSGLAVPNAGVVHLGAEEVTAWSPTRRARAGLRRTFQRPQIFGQLSVADNVLLGMEWRGGGGGAFGDVFRLPARAARERERRLRVDVVLESCGLVEVADVPAGRLPAGMARMVELARAIVDEPSALLLDEPTSGLDHREAERLRAVVEMECTRGCGVLLVEHDMQFVMEICDRIVVLDVGHVIADGTPDGIRADAAVRGAYLG